MGDIEPKRGEPEPRKAERNAGAFLGDGALGMIAAPMSTLSDEYHDAPTEPEDSDRVPEPVPPGIIQRVLGRLTGRRNPTD